jgi:O-antigen/teichoic acid export membrane protein
MTNSTISSKLFETVKHFFIYSIGAITKGSVSFLLLPIITNFFDPHLFGQYSIILLVSTIAGSIFFLGSNSILTRFYFEKNTEIHQITVITNSLIIISCGIVFQIIVAYYLSDYLSILLFDDFTFAFTILLALISSSFVIFNSFLTVLLRNQKKSIKYNIVLILNVFVNLLITYFLLEFRLVKEIINAPFIGVIAGNIVTILAMLINLYPKVRFTSINIRMIFEYLKFGVPIVVTGMIFYLIDWSDRFVIEYFCDYSEVGLYSFGYRIGTIIQMLFIFPFSLIWNTLRMEYSKSPDIGELTGTITRFYFLFGLIIVSILGIFSKEIVMILSSKDEFLSTYTIVPFIALGHLFYGFTNIADFGIQMSKRVYHLIWISFFSLSVNIILNILLIPVFGFQIAAINTLVTYFFMITIIYCISSRYIKFKIEYMKIFFLIISSLFINLLSIKIGFYNYGLYFKIGLLLVLLFAWYILILKNEEKSIMVAYVKKIIA